MAEKAQCSSRSRSRPGSITRLRRGAGAAVRGCAGQPGGDQVRAGCGASDEPEGLIAGLANSSLVDTTGLALSRSATSTSCRRACRRASSRGRLACPNATANRITDSPGPVGRARALQRRPHRAARQALPGGERDVLDHLARARRSRVWRLRGGFRSSSGSASSRTGPPPVRHGRQSPDRARGLYAWFRVGSGVVIDPAIRVLRVTRSDGFHLRFPHESKTMATAPRRSRSRARSRASTG